jgi:hypothetical protein
MLNLVILYEKWGEGLIFYPNGFPSGFRFAGQSPAPSSPSGWGLDSSILFHIERVDFQQKGVESVPETGLNNGYIDKLAAGARSASRSIVLSKRRVGFVERRLAPEAAADMNKKEKVCQNKQRWNG